MHHSVWAMCATVVCGLAAGPLAAAECNGAAVSPSIETPGRPPVAVLTMGTQIILVDDVGSTKQLVICEPIGNIFEERRRIDLSDHAVRSVGVRAGVVVVQTDEGEREYSVKGSGVSGGAGEVVPPEGLKFTVGQHVTEGVSLQVPLPGTIGGASAEIRLLPIVPGARIFTRKVLHIDELPKAVTVFWEEIGKGTRAFVATFVDGRIVAGAQVPLLQSDTIPENFVGVLSDGRPYYLRTKADKSTPVLLELDATFAQKVTPSGPFIEKRAPLEKSQTEPQRRGDIRLISPANAQDGQISDAEFQARVREATGDKPSQPLVGAGGPSIARADVVKCAEAFRDFVWTVTAGSYERPGVVNVCSPQSRFWRRPFYLKDKVGKQVTGVPYCWGCSDSLERFQERVKNETHLAGHSCTCRSGHYCLRNDSTGVDCSGFTSQCWKSGYYTTSSVSEIADEIDEGDIKPGDAFVRPGSHIRLFIGFTEGSTGIRIRVIEAANAEGEIGRVLEQTYTASQLSSYTPIKYRKITD